jgi:hypothetical protein
MSTSLGCGAFESHPPISAFSRCDRHLEVLKRSILVVFVYFEIVEMFDDASEKKLRGTPVFSPRAGKC